LAAILFRAEWTICSTSRHAPVDSNIHDERTVWQASVKPSCRGRQGQHHTGPRDGEPDAGGLVGLLRERVLVLGRVGHGEGEPVDELGVSAMPEPVPLSPPVEFPSRLSDKGSQSGGIEFGSRPAIVAGVPGRHASADLLCVGGEQGVSLGEGALNVLGGEDIGEGQTGLSKKGFDDVLEVRVVRDGLGGYSIHKKSPSWLLWELKKILTNRPCRRERCVP